LTKVFGFVIICAGDKEVMSMRELILEVEELEQRIAPGSASNGSQ